jgi:hypothetical protein
MQFTIRLASRPTWRVLLGLTGLLAVGHVASMVVTLGFKHESRRVRLLDLNEELSLGTAYSVALLVGSAVLVALLAVAARRRGGPEARDARWWAGLAVMFAFMGADEGVAIHEMLIVPVRKALNTSGLLFFAWVVPYGALVVAVVLVYIRLLFRLPRQIAIRFVIAGAVYVGGAVGLELIAGWMVDSLGYAERSLPMELEYLVEETMEMLGVAYFVTALLRYVELGGEPLQVSVAMPDARPLGTRSDTDRPNEVASRSASSAG